MRRRTKWFRTIVVGLLGLVGASAFWGCHRGNDPEEKAEWATSYISHKLDFNELQKAKLAEVSEEILALHAALRAEREKDLALLIQQVKSEALDTKQLTALWEKRRQKADEIVPVLINKLASLHGAMDDDQRTKVARFMERKMEKMQD